MSAPKGNKKKENKTDPTRFEGDGISFKGKFIGVADVWDSHGDEMCQETMQKLKAAVKSSGEHKLRILLNISLEGIKIIDEKMEAVNYTHMVNHISFVSKDASDSRAIGYVYGPGDGSHKFFAIKTEKSAEQVMFTVRDLFEVKKKELEDAAAREAAKNAKAEASKDGASVENESTKSKEKAEDDHVYSGMDSIGNALAHSNTHSPLGAAAAAQDNADPWNVNNQPGSACQTPSPLLQPPPPVVRSNSGNTSRGSFSLSTVGQQSPGGAISPQVAAAAFPMPVSSAFPPVASPGAAMPSGMFPVLPAAAAAAAASPPFTSTVVGNQIIMQSSPKLSTSPNCALPVVTDPFGDNLFSNTPTQVSMLNTPMPASQPFLVQPNVQPAFAAFPTQAVTPPAFQSSSSSGSLHGNSHGSSPNKFDAFSADSMFNSANSSAFNSCFGQQQTLPNTFSLQDQVLPSPGTHSPSNAAATAPNVSPGAGAPGELSIAPPTTAGTNLSQNLFEDLCNFGSKQPHKKPAELFPRLEPPVKKINDLRQEKEQTREQQNTAAASALIVGTPSPLPNDVFTMTPFQASDASIPSAGPSDDLLCDPKRLPEPSRSPMLPADPAFYPEKPGHRSSRSSGIFSFSGNHSTEVTYAVTTPEPSEIEFSHPAPSHPPPPLPPSIAMATSPDPETSPLSSSSAPDQKATTLSDDEEDFNLPAPAVPPPPLPSETILSLASQAPAPPPRPRPSEISKLPKPPPPKPRRNLSSSSSLQSMGKSNSPVPSTISQDGMTRADSGLAGSSVFSPSSPASDISNLSHSSAWADSTKFDSVFQASSISPGFSLDNTTNNNNSPQPWSTFTENENSYSPSSNRSLSSGRDFFPVTSTATRASSVSSWPDNNPFVVKTMQSPSLTNTVSPSPKSTAVDFVDPFPTFTTKSGPFVTTSSKTNSESPPTDPFTTTSSNTSSSSNPAQVDDPFVVPAPFKQKLDKVENDPFAVPSLAKSHSSSVSADDPFVVPSQTKLQLNSAQPDPFVLPPATTLKSDTNQTTQPFVIPCSTQLKSDNVQADPFVISMQTKQEIDKGQSDPFVCPSSTILPTNGTRTDPFEGFNQWSTPSSVNVNTANGCTKFSWETSFETEPIYAVVNKQK